MKQGRTDRDWMIVAVLTFIAGVVVTVLICGNPTQTTAEKVIDWPAWVQAVGSVAGIFAAVGVPVWQRYLSDLEKREREKIEQMARAMKFRRALETFLRNIKQNAPIPSSFLNVGRPLPRITDMVPPELKAILHETNLIPPTGGTVLTAVNFAEQAQDSIIPGQHARSPLYERYRKHAETRCEMALDEIKKLLTALSEGTS